MGWAQSEGGGAVRGDPGTGTQLGGGTWGWMDGWWDTAEEGCRERGVGDTMEGTLGQEQGGGRGRGNPESGIQSMEGGGTRTEAWTLWGRGDDTMEGTQGQGQREWGGYTGKRKWGGLQRGPRNVGGGAGGQQRGDYPGTRDGGWGGTQWGGRRGGGTPQGGNSRRDPGMKEWEGHGGGYPGAGGWGGMGGGKNNGGVLTEGSPRRLMAQRQWLMLSVCRKCSPLI